jgi:hypothetical protein
MVAYGHEDSDLQGGCFWRVRAVRGQAAYQSEECSVFAWEAGSGM